jgi:Ca-activated chloride channel family protein
VTGKLLHLGLGCAGAILCAILSASAFGGDEPRVSIEPRAASEGLSQTGPTIRVQSNLVLIPVTVTDPKNRSVVGLDRETFRVFDGRTEQKVTHFSSDDAPVSV